MKAVAHCWSIAIILLLIVIFYIINCMFGYYIKQVKKPGLLSNNKNALSDSEGFTTSIKGFRTKEEAQQALKEAEQEVMFSSDFKVVDGQVYEYKD